MPRKRELTWQDGSGKRKGRWRKWYRGQAYYLPYGTSKSDTAGYQKALKAWRAKKAEVDAEEANRPQTPPGGLWPCCRGVGLGSSVVAGS
jgi:hypothetical protein